MFVYDTQKYIGSYAAAMNGVDAIVFTAGVGENNPNIRQMVCENLSYLGITIDNTANEICGEEVKLSTEDSEVEVYVVPTNEELAICQETVKLVESS